MTFIGIDVSKKTLDVAALYEAGEIKYQKFSNTQTGYTALGAWLGDFEACHIVLEATGSYHERLAQALTVLGVHFSVVRQYPMEFKIDAVKLLEEKGYTVSEAANSLGIPQANLTKWRKQYREGRLLPGHRRAQPTAEEAELRRLQGEVKRLEMELAIVKKAAIYFARHST